MEELSLPDILAILKRRQRVFGVTFTVLFALACLFALEWSNYRSIATVEIELPNISANNAIPNSGNLGDSVFALADHRISQIQQNVTALGSLAEIITKFNLYPSARETTPIAVLTDNMRNKIKLNFISSMLANPAAAEKETAEELSAIAFTLSFDYSDPQTVQRVTDELVTRFLDEDLKLRRTQAQSTSEFLAMQIKELEATMAEQDKKIAEFRAAHGESGPSILMFNEEGASSTSLGIQNIDSQLTNNEGEQGSLRAQLALVDPYSRVIADGQVITTPAIQLKALEAQYATLSAQYGPEYPDLVKTRNQIEALKAQVKSDGGLGDSVNNSAQLKAQIADLETNLAAAKNTDGPDNPDVIALTRQLKKLKVQLASTPDDYTRGDGIKADADNPAYLQLAIQLRAAEEQHKTLLAQREKLIAEQDKYKRSLADMPGLEEQMAALSRDYDSSQLRYRELKEKKMAADMSTKLEEDRKGQRLVIINPPSIPKNTYPSQILLVLGGFVLSLICGVGSVAISEAMNQNIHGPNHLASVVGHAPLVTIPYIVTADEQNQPHRLLMPMARLSAFFRAIREKRHG